MRTGPTGTNPVEMGTGPTGTGLFGTGIGPTETGSLGMGTSPTGTGQAHLEQEHKPKGLCSADFLSANWAFHSTNNNR